MCIIVAKNKAGRLPTIDELKNCFNNNDDGAGFMYVNNGRVVIDKGYMTIKSFIKRYKKLCKRFNNFENKALVIHCRIGTSGNNSPENCHPYPVNNNLKNLKKLYFTDTLGVAHNGIISAYNPLKIDGDINDTQKFIVKFLSPLYKNYKQFYKNEDILNGIENLIKSKLAILDTNENLKLVGDFINDNELYFSNGTYKNSYWFGYNNYYGNSYSHNTYNSYNTTNYISKNEKEENKEVKKNLFMIKLAYNWNVLDNDEWYRVDDKRLYFDTNTYELYEELDDNTLSLISTSALIYDEYNELLY